MRNEFQKQRKESDATLKVLLEKINNLNSSPYDDSVSYFSLSSKFRNVLNYFNFIGDKTNGRSIWHQSGCKFLL
jgi:hypothetical protein